MVTSDNVVLLAFNRALGSCSAMLMLFLISGCIDRSTSGAKSPSSLVYKVSLTELGMPGYEVSAPSGGLENCRTSAGFEIVDGQRFFVERVEHESKELCRIAARQEDGNVIVLITNKIPVTLSFDLPRQLVENSGTRSNTIEPGTHQLIAHPVK